MRGWQFASSARRHKFLAMLAVGCASAAVLTSPLGAPVAAQADGGAARGRLLAQSYLVASEGGRVRARNGVELRVPPRVMRRNGTASIRGVRPRSFDIHIAAPWRGTVIVILPLRKGKALGVAHRVGRRWVMERGATRHGRVVLRVRHLSVFDTDEERRYAAETMNLGNQAFLARKADFTNAGCNADEPKPGGCRKPPPYNLFDWTDNGCSGPAPFYFEGPCKQHDFGYRNYGKRRLGADEDTRAWIDLRFREEMNRVCDGLFGRTLEARGDCYAKAYAVWGVVRHAGDSFFYGDGPPEPGRPLPEIPEPAEPLPDPGYQPLPPLEPVPTNPEPPQTPAPAHTWPEQQGSLGANTFTNPYNASGMGVKIQPYQSVQVTCKVYAPQILSANPDGYWYRIASAPWSNGYYAVANTFWNGDIPGQKPYTHNTDWAVPNC